MNWHASSFSSHLIIFYIVQEFNYLSSLLFSFLLTSLEQIDLWFLIRDSYTPRRVIQQIFLVVTAWSGRRLLTSRKQRARMLLNTLHCTGQSPTTKNIRPEMTIVMRLRNTGGDHVFTLFLPPSILPSYLSFKEPFPRFSFSPHSPFL